MKSRIKIKFLAVVAFVALATQTAFVSCSDDPGAENYYTSKSEYASDYLRNRSQFSEFVQIIQKSNPKYNIFDLLGTWGSYTVFAPTNEAIDKYLATKGLTSVEQLSQADCDTITYNHIIEQAFFTTDVSEDVYPKTNMLDLLVSIKCDSDTVSVPGEVQLAIYINKNARMIHADDSVENGVVHTLNSVMGMQNDLLPDVMAEDSTISLFVEALKLTHMDDSLQRYKDYSYSVGSDSIDWTNDKLVLSTATEYDNVAYPQYRYFKFTAFVEPNSVYEKYGVTDIEGLKALAKQIYDPVYPDDADVTDPTDRRNSLNRFVSYHLLDRLGTYYSLTCVDGGSNTLAKNFVRTKWDIADWYETMMPHSILKCSFPSGSENGVSISGLYINRRGVQGRADSRGYKYRGAMITSRDNGGLTAINGVYHYIDDIICYGIDPTPAQVGSIQDYVFSERLRIDCSTLSPDFMTSGARGHYTNSSVENGKYGVWDATKTHTNKQTCLGFKAGSAKNFEFDDANTHIHVRPRTLTFWSYQGDEVTLKGIYDVTIKLPPVPEGDWELRMLTCVNFQSRGIVQYYIDGVPQGLPFDMRPSGENPRIGWKSDASLGDEEQIAAFDKQFRNRTWMKGPKSYKTGESASAMRDLSQTLRKIIGTFHSDGKTDHYLRLQQKLNSKENECNFDFIELCPSAVYANPDLAEDRW